MLVKKVIVNLIRLINFIERSFDLSKPFDFTWYSLLVINEVRTPPSILSAGSCAIVHGLTVLNYSLLKIIQVLLIQDAFELLRLSLWDRTLDYVNGADDVCELLLIGISSILVLGYGSRLICEGLDICETGLKWMP